MSWRRRKKFLLAVITLGLVLSFTALQESKASNKPMFKTKIDLNAPVSFDQAEAKFSLSGDIGLRKLLRRLGQYSGLNIVLDESIEGSITLALNDVTVREAFDYLRNIAGLYYVPKGNNILLITTKDSADQKGLTKTVSKLIPIKYVNATLVASLLENTVFSSSGGANDGAGEGNKKATAEFRTNSIILVGTDNDIRLAEELIDRIDIPRESKTFTINHAEPVEVAQLLQATVFNDGVSPFNGSGEGQGGDGMSVQSTPITVSIETLEEGEGSSEVEGASGQGGGGSSQTFTLRTKKMASEEINISPDGPMIIPDTRTSTLTIMGTVEQIALAESLIPSLDQKLPQVAIETSLIELFDIGQREGKVTYGGSSGQFGLGYDNTTIPSKPTAGSPGAGYRPAQAIQRQSIDSNGNVVTNYYLPGVMNNIIGLPTSTSQGSEGFAFNWTTVPLERSNQFIAQVDNIIGTNKGKLLANPTVIAVHNTEAIISITEEIIRSTTVTRDSAGFTQTQAEIGEAGIVLNILPKVTGDGYVVMRIRPSVSTVAQTLSTGGGNLVTLLNRRDLAVQEVRIANGQTLLIGGLIKESSTSSNSKVPGIADLPIIGAMFRSSYKDTNRSELLTLITPRIMEDSVPISTDKVSQLLNKPEFRAMLDKTNTKLKH